jgi:hypothetical protein
MLPGTPSSDAAATAASAAPVDPHRHFVDSLLRSDRTGTDRADAPLRAEVGLILARGLREGDVAAPDSPGQAVPGPARSSTNRTQSMPSILLLVLGMPIPIIILVGLFSHF